MTALLVSRRPGRPLSHRFLYVFILETLFALALLQVALVSPALRRATNRSVSFISGLLPRLCCPGPGEEERRPRRAFHEGAGPDDGGGMYVQSVFV